MKNYNLENLLEDHLKKKLGINEKKRGTDGVIYTRVSTMEQMMENGSLETQKKLDEEYALKNNIRIVEYFGGKHESAKTDGRKEFQRMLEYVKKHLNVKFIIISNYDRFSRTGATAAKLSEDLRKEYGVIVKSVTQDIDTSTASGRLQENFFHLFNNFDNVLKSERTKVNTKEILLKGYWPYHLPKGYTNLNPQKRACFHTYVLNEDAKAIKQAFILKAEGKITNREIIEKIKLNGVELCEKTFHSMIANPFYIGYVTGKLVDGKLIKGHHPKLIDEATFLKANEILSKARNVKVPKKFNHDALPLKIFIKDEISGDKLSGCKSKGIWYYKTKQSSTPLNIKAEILNNLFVEELRKFEVPNKYTAKLKKLIAEELSNRLSMDKEGVRTTKKLISEKETELEKIEVKFLKDEISKEVYEKHTTKVKLELAKLNKELELSDFSSANLGKAVGKCLEMAQNLESAWVSADYQNKQRLQYLIFPEGMYYNKKINRVRTPKINALFESIPIAARVLIDKKKGNFEKNCLYLLSVPRTGIEPALPCDNQILSLARLPIPPSGRGHLSILGGKNRHSFFNTQQIFLLIIKFF
jgi:site-specific DNA recombinase